MKIYVIGEKKDFNENQIKRLQELGTMVYIEEIKDKYNEEYTKDEEEKILVVDPDKINWELKNDLIDKISNLKGICLMSTSYSYVDVNYCNKKGIIVTNVPKYSTDSVTEYACFLMMAIARKLPMQIKNNFKEEFTEKYLQTQIKNAKVGIIGLGSIGKRLAEILKGLGLDILYWSRNSRDNRFKYNELEDIFKSADFIFPTFAINEETKKIISEELINSMKKSASIISIVGTDCLNKELIINKVKNNELYGFAFESAEDSLNNYDGNIMITAPYAWYTEEALENCIEIWVQSIEGVATGKIVNSVNNN